MRFNWLESKAVSIVFLCSAIDFSSLCAFVFLLAIPGVTQFLNSSVAKNPLVVLFGVLAVVGIPSLLVLFFGMAIFCACVDRASVGTKAVWFVLFLVAGPIGSTVYYFAVYRGAINRKKTGSQMMTAAPIGV
jgi:TM2 domain-containing membrane protein YozV